MTRARLPVPIVVFVALALHHTACSSSAPTPPDVPGVTDVPDVTDVSDVTDVTDVPDVTDAPLADVPDAALTDVPDASDGCLLTGYGVCPRGTSCVIGRCPDGTPVSCFCSLDGQPLCTGACPPPPDASIACGEARPDPTTPGCEAAVLQLDPAICRCILGYFWDGRACVSSASCRCLGHCERLYPSEETCRAAYARCPM